MDFFQLSLPENQKPRSTFTIPGASLVAQLVKSLPAVWETQVEKGTGLENSMDCMYSPWGLKESDTTEQL